MDVARVLGGEAECPFTGGASDHHSPEELGDRSEERGARRTRVPATPGGKRASASNPAFAARHPREAPLIPHPGASSIWRHVSLFYPPTINISCVEFVHPFFSAVSPDGEAPAIAAAAASTLHHRLQDGGGGGGGRHRRGKHDRLTRDKRA